MPKTWEVVRQPYLHFVSSDGDVVSADEMAMYVTGFETMRPTPPSTDEQKTCKQCEYQPCDETPQNHADYCPIRH